jgi:hypothetical protein
VQVVDRASELPHDTLYIARVHAVRASLQLFEQRPIDVLENEVQLALPPEELVQRNDVLVVELLQNAHLAQRSLSDLLIFVALLELFDCDDAHRFTVPRLEHHAIRALSNRPEEFVCLHNAGRGQRKARSDSRRCN